MKKSGEIPTAFPKGTIVHYKGIPCELLQDTPYYSETFKGRKRKQIASQQTDSADGELEGACPDCDWPHSGDCTFPRRS